MKISNRIKLNRLHISTAILLTIVLLLSAYNFAILLPNQRKANEEISSLKKEITKLKSELDEKKVFSDCDKEAETKARTLLAKKIELGKVSGGYDVQEYKKAYDLGLRLKDDYNSFYENCLRRHGVKY